MAMTPGYRILLAFIVSSFFAVLIYILNLVPPFSNDPGNVEIILISVAIFVSIYLAFVAYFLIRNLFSKRWAVLKNNNVNSRIFRIPIKKNQSLTLTSDELQQFQEVCNPHSKEISIPIYDNHSSLLVELIFPLNQSKNTLILYCHGFNDSSEKIRYKTYALAELGHTVLVYDARGMGKSSKAGKKNEFLTRNTDTAAILQFITNISHFSNHQVVIVGESMGGISAAYVMNYMPRSVNKCILISTPSIFNQTFPRRAFPFSRKWFQKLSYSARGINPFPREDENMQLSPYLQFQEMKGKFSESEWATYTNKTFLLIHSKTDKLISVKKCNENISMLNLDENNSVLFESGNHNQIKNELGILSAIDQFISKK